MFVVASGDATGNDQPNRAGVAAVGVLAFRAGRSRVVLVFQVTETRSTPKL